MAGWSVQPSGVETVLKNVAQNATGITDALGGSKNGKVASAEVHVQDAAQAAESQVIGQAIATFFEKREGTLKGVVGRISACVTGAAQATQAIIDGDDAMAAHTQAAAVKAGKSGDFSAYTKG